MRGNETERGKKRETETETSQTEGKKEILNKPTMQNLYSHTRMEDLYDFHRNTIGKLIGKTH